MVNNGNRTFLLLELILADQLADVPPPVETSSGQEWHFHISTVRAHIALFIFLQLELMLADLSPPVEESSGQEWHFHISTFRAHIRRSTGRSLCPLVEASSSQ